MPEAAMKIIISPAKKMNTDTDTLPWTALPVYLEQAERLMDYMRSLSLGECQRIWKCNDKIALQNYDRFQQMDVRRCLTPAILSYEGLQYQYMAPAVLEEGALEYLQKNLRILSGFYGVLRPFDGVVPYRLEMQARLGGEDIDSLYQFWGELPFRELTRDGETIILNLASKEYSKIIEAHLKTPGKEGLSTPASIITCVFGEERGGKIKEKGTYAKMARGEMVRFLAEHRIEDVEAIKAFDRLNYKFSPEHSDEKKLVFLHNL